MLILNKNFYDAVLSAVKKVWNTENAAAKWIYQDFDETGRCYAETDEPYDYWNTK